MNSSAEVATTASRSADSVLADATASESALRRFLHGLPGVDEVGAQQRADDLAKRSIKAEAKAKAIAMAIRMTDLTTLEGQDTAGKVRALCIKAMRPDPTDSTVPSVAAVCVYPDLVETAVQALAGSTVQVASVATAFPSGRSFADVKLLETRRAIEAGATEIDMVIDRGAFLAGRYGVVLDEIRQVKAGCGDAHLKVILETGELATLDNTRRASWLALAGGADFIKTSTGKVNPASTTTGTLVMLQAVRDYFAMTGQRRGVKSAGGIRTTKQAVRYLVLVNEVAGPKWLTPDLFRFGASSLLNDLLLQRHKQSTGRYWSPDYLTLD